MTPKQGRNSCPSLSRLVVTQANIIFLFDRTSRIFPFNILIFSVLIKNIQNVDETEQEEIKVYINTILEDEDLLEMEYKEQDFSVEDSVNWKKIIAQKIHEKVQNATININVQSTLKEGELNVSIEVDNLPYGIEKITKQILYSSKKASKTNTDEKTNFNNFDDIVAEINNWIYENNTFTVHNKAKKEATYFFEKEIINYFKDNGLNVPTFLNNADMEEEIGKSLTEEQNKIKIRLINPQNNKSNDVFITLKGVKPASKLKALKEVKTNYEGEKKFKQSILPTYECIILIYQKWLDGRSLKDGTIISLKDPNKLNKKISEGNNFIAVNYSNKDKKVSGIIRPFLIILPDLGSAFDVPGDGSCLFWSYATAYLLAVRSNNEKFKVRFEELFGNNQLTNLKHVQTLLNSFALENKIANQSFYNDEIVKELVKKIFRNKVVDYIEQILKADYHEKKDILISAIQNMDDNNKKNVDINDYLQKMRIQSKWGGDVEIIAMIYMYNCSITIVNENNSDNTEFKPLNEIAKSNIKLFRKGEVHYNFYLPEEIE